MQTICNDASTLAISLQWAETEGWNPGKHDNETFAKVDSEGFWMGFKKGAPISSISTVSWNETFAFIGLYIVVPEARGKGYGWELWQHAIETNANKCLALDGVIAQQEKYAKSGFKFAYRSLRWVGKAAQFHGLDSNAVPLAECPSDQIQALDAQVSPADRPRYLQAWLQQPKAVSFGILEDGQLQGFASARPCAKGWKIGPLVARTPDQAQQLVVACCRHLSPGHHIYLDTPEPNQDVQKLCADAGMKVSFEVARMYTKPVRDHRLDWVYGVTSFELG